MRIDTASCDPIGGRRRIHDVELLSAARDESAIKRVAGGDSRALEELYERYGAPCYSLARRIVRDPALAQDVVQEVFLTCWRSGGYDATRGSVASWLLAITHNKAVDLVRKEERLRSRRVGEEALDDLAAAAGSTEEQAWSLVQAAAVRGALRDLPTEQREVLLLAYYGGYSQREISTITGVPLGTVKSRTLGAIKRLREVLGSQVDKSKGEG